MIGSEEGAAAVVMVAVGAVLVVLSVLLADVGGYLGARLQAAAAADAAALAAAPVTWRPFGAEGSPAQEASKFASANGAQLVSCRCPVDRSWNARRVEVEVRRTVDLLMMGRRTVTATSRAEFAPANLADPPP